MSEMGSVLKAASLARTVAEYLGLIEGLGLKLARLTQSELGAAITALQQAGSSTSEQTTLLREARAPFNKAVHLESGERLAVAHFGLAICHHKLDDFDNARASMQTIYDHNFVGSTIKKMLFSVTTIGPLIRDVLTLAKIEPLRKQAAIYLGKIDLE